MKTVITIPNLLRVHLVNKNASHAMSKSLAKTNFHYEEVGNLGKEKRLMVVRDPVDRALSSYNFFCQDEVRLDRQQNLKSLGFYYQMPFEEYLSVVENNLRKDSHIRPQMDFHGPHHINYLIPIEKLNTFWKTLKIPRVKPLEWTHKTKGPVHLDNKIKRRIQNIYLDDLILYERATDVVTNTF